MTARRRTSAALCRWLILASGCSAGQGQATDALMAELLAGDHARLEERLRRGEAAERRLPDGSKPLAWAIERQDATAVRLLLKHGARVDDPDPAGNAFRPLIVACLYPSEPVLDLLLAEAVDVNVQGPEGISALSLCAAHAPPRIVEALIKGVPEVAGQLPTELSA